MKTHANKVGVQLGPLLFSFSSFDDWCDTARHRFAAAGVRGDDATCLDRLGRVCEKGLEFMRARDEGTFPIQVYKSLCGSLPVVAPAPLPSTETQPVQGVDLEGPDAHSLLRGAIGFVSAELASGDESAMKRAWLTMALAYAKQAGARPLERVAEAEPWPLVEGHVFDYPAAARSILLNLAEFVDGNLHVTLAIADAARKARAKVESLEARAQKAEFAWTEASHEIEALKTERREAWQALEDLPIDDMTLADGIRKAIADARLRSQEGGAAWGGIGTIVTDMDGYLKPDYMPTEMQFRLAVKAWRGALSKLAGAAQEGATKGAEGEE